MGSNIDFGNMTASSRPKVHDSFENPPGTKMFYSVLTHTD